jgi:hypothetical protein
MVKSKKDKLDWADKKATKILNEIADEKSPHWDDDSYLAKELRKAYQNGYNDSADYKISIVGYRLGNDGMLYKKTLKDDCCSCAECDGQKKHA